MNRVAFSLNTMSLILLKSSVICTIRTMAILNWSFINNFFNTSCRIIYMEFYIRSANTYISLKILCNIKYWNISKCHISTTLQLRPSLSGEQWSLFTIWHCILDKLSIKAWGYMESALINYWSCLIDSYS